MRVENLAKHVGKYLALVDALAGAVRAQAIASRSLARASVAAFVLTLAVATAAVAVLWRASGCSMLRAHPAQSTLRSRGDQPRRRGGSSGTLQCPTLQSVAARTLPRALEWPWQPPAEEPASLLRPMPRRSPTGSRTPTPRLDRRHAPEPRSTRAVGRRSRRYSAVLPE